MLTVEENERLTQIGPGTPMGEMMRRYWHPIAGSAQLMDKPVMPVRVLGENLVLFKDKRGRLGLIQDLCAHRQTQLMYGMVEEDGLRCPYHGWMYDRAGRCIEQPAEPPGSTFKDRVTITAYPVEELGGLIFAYMGPEPTPLVPRWDVLVRDHALRDIGVKVSPCNWLQLMENVPDPVHVEHLHGKYGLALVEQLKREGKAMAPGLEGASEAYALHFMKTAYDEFEHGIIKRRVLEGGTEEDEPWQIGQSVIFPTMGTVYGGGVYGYHFETPIDDYNTLSIFYQAYDPGPEVEVPKQEVVPVYEVPIYDENGQIIVNFIDGQDSMVIISQGVIADRSKEKLGESDKGVILYRRQLKEQMELVLDGGEPMNTFRDPAQNQCLNLPKQKVYANMGLSGGFKKGDVVNGSCAMFSPIIDEVEELFAKAAEAKLARDGKKAGN